jgi:excisionase family DNA binding protein
MKSIPKLDSDLKAVAAALNITVPYARQLWLRGAIPGYRLGHRTLRFRLADVMAALASRKGAKHVATK